MQEIVDQVLEVRNPLLSKEAAQPAQLRAPQTTVSLLPLPQMGPL